MAGKTEKCISLSNEEDLQGPHSTQPWKRISFRCAKTVVCIFNGFFWLLGWTLIGVGISLQGSMRRPRYNIEGGEYEDSMMRTNGGYSSAAELCLLIGCIIVIVVSLACCGTHTENHLILGIYLAVVMIFLSFEIVAITVISFHKEKVEQRIITDIKLTMDFYKVKNFNGITKSIDTFQKVFHCCGCIDYADWFNTTWGKHHRMNVPNSCLKNGSSIKALDENMIDTSTAIFAINKEGCFKHVRNYLVKNLHIFRTFVAWIFGIQIIGLVFSMCLFCKYRHCKAHIASNYNIVHKEY